MSRRMRFQVKPNLNLPASTPMIAADDGKQSTTTTNIASTPSADPKSTTTTTTNESQEISSTTIAQIEESPQFPPPSPKPPPPSSISVEQRGETNPDENIGESTKTTTTTQDSSISGTTEEDIEIGQQFGADNSSNVATDASTTMENNTIIDEQATTSGALLSENSHLIQQLSKPPAVLPEIVNKQKVDWRTMRQSLKGKKLDRATFTMRDLVFWAPQESDDEEGAEEGDDAASVSSAASSVKRKSSKRRRLYTPRFETPPPPPTQSQSGQEKEKHDEAKTTAPQVKVNADGSIAIDETSLVVDRRDQGTGTDFETVDETWGYGNGRGPRLTSMSFRRNRLPLRGKPWSKLETDKFYRVLAFAGMDFCLIHELFPARSRLELKRKFKRESNENQHRINQAVMSTTGRHGTWEDLKKAIIDRGRVGGDERGDALLETAREMIEEEDERIELEAGVRKPSVAEATRIADRICKNGFGEGLGNDDDEEVGVDDEALPTPLKKKRRVKEPNSKKLEKEATRMIEQLQKEEQQEAKRKETGQQLETKRLAAEEAALMRAVKFAERAEKRRKSNENEDVQEPRRSTRQSSKAAAAKSDDEASASTSAAPSDPPTVDLAIE